MNIQVGGHFMTKKICSISSLPDGKITINLWFDETHTCEFIELDLEELKKIVRIFLVEFLARE